ncbi:hypothetical protein BASA61_000814 [Batrachochytrium salamandrivorans]|nr:hypothetical protein BASA61_000814 [Batrachochytrium salamandrivorans]
MSNTTSIAELARQLTRTRDYGVFKMCFAILQIVLIVICIPLFIHERKQPMVKYRSWIVNILACVGATMSILMDGCVSMDYWVPYRMIPVVYYIRAICVLMAGCAFLPTYVRHYFLLRLPVLQTKLLDYDTMMDPDKYKALSRSLIRIKFLSSETFAISFYATNFFICLFLLIYYFTITDFDMMILGLSNPADTYLANISVVQISLSLVFLLSYGPWSPKDNFQIMTQFYIVTILALLNCMSTIIGTISSSIETANIFYAVSVIFSSLAVMVDLAVPLQFLLVNSSYKRHKTNSLHTETHKGHIMSSSSLFSARMSPSKTLGHISSTADPFASNTLTSSPKLASGHVVKSSHYPVSRIIADAALRAAFCKYLSREFSMESLVFIETVKRFKEQVRISPTTETVEIISDKIMTEFIYPNSVNEVNLPEKTVTRLKARLTLFIEGGLDIESTVLIFDEATEYIEKMLTLNHLTRFQASQMFRDATSTYSP